MDDSWLVPEWPAPAGVRAVVTTRGGPGISAVPFERFNLGSRCGDDPAAVAHNRAALAVALSLPCTPFWLRQVHGVEVAEATANAGIEPAADASHAQAPGDVLAILTADCMPVLFCNDIGEEIAAAHAGWRGLAGGILEATVGAFEATPDQVMAWMGPCIGAASYEVGEEVRAAFVDHDAGAVQAFVATRPGHWLCDLYALARRRLLAAGVSRIHGGGFDTFTDRRFYSYRRDRAGSGRFASLIWTQGAPWAP
jgi:YfiH family protein